MSTSQSRRSHGWAAGALNLRRDGHCKNTTPSVQERRREICCATTGHNGERQWVDIKRGRNRWVIDRCCYLNRSATGTWTHVSCKKKRETPRTDAKNHHVEKEEPTALSLGRRVKSQLSRHGAHLRVKCVCSKGRVHHVWVHSGGINCALRWLFVFQGQESE